MTKYCKHCGLSEHEHHEFEASIVVPDGCICDPGTWDGYKPTGICPAYKGDGNVYCITCEHDKACHKA